MSSSSRPSGLRTPSRRMTLGGVPSSSNRSNNRRMSMDPSSNNASSSGRSSAAKPTRPPRKSMLPRVGGRENYVPPSPGGVNAPTASSRRRSVGGNGNSSTSRRQSYGYSVPPPVPSVHTDPRPINDKRYHNDCIKRLLQFLTESNYEYPITSKSLKAPSGKDFTNIVTFMLRLVDPSFGNGTMKLEDEVAMNFKALGYPFPISKTALVAAGSPHTWPSLLAALTWLMEHLQCFAANNKSDNTAEHSKPFSTLAELEQQTDKAFFAYLSQAYVAFLQGDQARTEQLEQALAERFERDDAILESEVERITDLNATIVEKINLMMQESEDLPNYAKKRQDYANDLEQFHDLIRQMDQHKAQLAAKVKERTAELNETNVKLTKMNQHVVDLEKLVENQELSPDDLLRLENEQKGVAEALDRTLETKEERRQALQEAQDKWVRARNDLDAAVLHYNTKLSHVTLSVAPEFQSQFRSLQASVDHEQLLETDPRLHVGVDLDRVVKPAVLRCKSEYVTKHDEAKWAYQDALDQLNKTEEAYKDAKAKLKIVQDKTTMCQETLASEVKAQEAKLAVRQREVEAMEAKVASLRDPVALEEQMAGYERQCAELEALQAKHLEENVAKKRAVQDEIDQAVTLMVEHDEHFQAKVAELDEYWATKQARAGHVTVPSNIELDD